MNHNEKPKVYQIHNTGAISNLKCLLFNDNKLNGVTLPDWIILTADKPRWKVINTNTVVKTEIENEGDLKKITIMKSKFKSNNFGNNLTDLTDHSV